MYLNSISENWHLFTVSGYFKGPDVLAVINYEFMEEHGILVGAETRISNLKDYICNFIVVPRIKRYELQIKMINPHLELRKLRIKTYADSVELMTEEPNNVLADKTNRIEELALPESKLYDFNLGSNVLLRFDQPPAIEKPF